MHPSTTLQRILSGFAAILMLSLLTGCFHNYYKTIEPAPSNTDQYVSAPKYQNRYFILRSGDNAYHMSNVILSEDRKSIACRLDDLESDHMLHLYRGRDGRMRYKAYRPEAAVLNEVHLYIPVDTTARLHSGYIVSVNKVTRVEVVKKNKVRTIASYALCFGVIASVIVASSFIVAASDLGITVW